MKPTKLTDVQKIFLLAATDNRQDLLPNNGWEWPTETWLQKRLEELKKEKRENESDLW